MLLHKVRLPKRRGKWCGIEKVEKLKMQEEATYISSALWEAFCNPTIAIHSQRRIPAGDKGIYA